MPIRAIASPMTGIKRDWPLGTLLRERKVGQTRSLGRASFWMRQKTSMAAARLGVAALLSVVTVSLVRPGGPYAFFTAAQAAIARSGRWHSHGFGLIGFPSSTLSGIQTGK